LENHPESGIIYLESVPLDILQSPEGAVLEDEIFRRNADKLFPLLRWDRNQADRDKDSKPRGLDRDISGTRQPELV